MQDLINRICKQHVAILLLIILMLTGVIIVSSSGCKNIDNRQVSSGVLPDGIMADILADIYLTEGVMVQLEYNQKKLPYSGVPYYKLIFDKHGVSRDEFVQSLRVYSENQEMIDGLYDKVVQRLSEQQLEVQGEKDKKDGDL